MQYLDPTAVLRVLTNSFSDLWNFILSLCYQNEYASISFNLSNPNKIDVIDNIVSTVVLGWMPADDYYDRRAGFDRVMTDIRLSQ